MRETLYNPGENGGAVPRARRVSFVVDADGYFRLFRRAAERAECAIGILAWDFDSRTVLEQEDGKAPIVLGDFLNGLARRKRRLRMRILDWDYPIVFGTDREIPPTLGLAWKPHAHIDFRFDDTHPVAGSHHQKIVLVDGRLAFVGGLDLANKRWETCGHKADEPRRTFDTDPYPPFHTVLIAVDAETGVLSRGWLEEMTMSPLRTKLVRELRAADKNGRFHCYYPDVTGLCEGTCLDIHSKVMIVDDEWCRVGSSNLSNRSMGMDTECDITLEAQGDRKVAAAIRLFRDLLIGEHSGTTPAKVAKAHEAAGSMSATIESLGSATRKRLERPAPELTGAKV